MGAKVDRQGFVHPEPFDRVSSALRFSNTHLPLKSLPLERIDPSRSEVAGIIPIPLSTFNQGNHDRRRDLHFFRMDERKPYWTYKCGDLVIRTDDDEPGSFGLAGDSGRIDRDIVSEKNGHPLEECNQSTRVGSGRPEAAILWGLSGWFLHRFLRMMDWTSDPIIRSEE